MNPPPCAAMRCVLLALLAALAVAFGSPVAAAPATAAPGASIAVSETEGLAPAGESITITGSGFYVHLGQPVVTALSADACEVTDATFTWGFKEAFRSYISGTIANGEWTVSDGAAYETPHFSWSGGAGGYDAEAEEGELAFTGTVTFTGHGGILNTSVANPRIEIVDAETARLYLDVAGTTQDGTAVDQRGVHFADVDLGGVMAETAEGELTITGAPAELSTEGSEAFGTYEPGTELDPVTVTFTIEEGCGVDVAEAAEADADADVVPPVASGTPVWLPWVIVALLVLLVTALVVVLLRRRTASAAE
ncbi:HtaA domain-containing protein [Salinibacterium sp. SYSU T00001]|uniref:HtaA domain-containing protein n=1 Tax=Homoserinimonas sedimenticola TaxID=2986805 RepID=UPI002236BF53|nr:HtaA domain-containing protein [Salinibacterium sedimenticola]MCW4386140.1 HtaA domain-containing protein [Salinibacterium sedimenticola]